MNWGPLNYIKGAGEQALHFGQLRSTVRMYLFFFFFGFCGMWEWASFYISILLFHSVHLAKSDCTDGHSHYQLLASSVQFWRHT